MMAQRNKDPCVSLRKMLPQRSSGWAFTGHSEGEEGKRTDLQPQKLGEESNKNHWERKRVSPEQ